MNKIRIAVIGLGVMGSEHARYILNGEIPEAELKAVCDTNEERLEWARENLKTDLHLFRDADSLFNTRIVDAVMIATPHYDHPPLAVKAFEHGLHVLIEKPAGVYTKQVRTMNEVASNSGKVFGIMYNQRVNPLYQKLKDLIGSGEIGVIRRTNWIVTTWYRSQSYYDSGGWRATWKGEGGGVLLNQCPHQLDIWQWTCGMPQRLRAFCYFGKLHDIEVEDDVTAFVEYDNGATGVFITSTFDTPGTNRFEVIGEKGKAVIENGNLHFWKLRIPERQFSREHTSGFGEPESWSCNVPVQGTDTMHPGITRNWIDAIKRGTPLLAPGQEGIKGLSLSNAMHLSTWTDSWVDLPLDEDLFLSMLEDRIRSSSGKEKRKTLDQATMDLQESF